MLNETSLHSATAQPQAEEIRAALDNLLNQSEFQGSNRIKKFLLFVVERSLEGQLDMLKAPSIATHVFDRDQNFDAHANPIVRVEATRLRKVLRAVYERADFIEPVEIELPLGSYAPVFRYRRYLGAPHDASNVAYAASALRDPSMKSARQERIGQALFPYRFGGSTMFAIGALVVASFFMFADGSSHRVVPVGLEPANGPSDLRPIISIHSFNRREMTPRDQLLQGQIQRSIVETLSTFDTVQSRIVTDREMKGADYHIISNLQSEPMGPLVNFTRHDGSLLLNHHVLLPVPDLPQDEIVRARSELIKVVARFVGEVDLDLEMRQSRKRALPDGLTCSTRWREFFAMGGEGARQASLKCLAQVADGRPDSYLAQARLSALWFEHFVSGQPTLDKRDAMQEAFRHAQQAIYLAPSRAAGLSAYARILLLTSADDKTALQLARAAYDMSPLDPDARAILGSTLIVLGQFAEGQELLRNLLLDYPSYPSWVRLYLFAAAVEQDDVEEQRLQVAVSDRQDSPFVILGRLAFHVMAKNDVAGEEAYRRLSRVEQTMADNPASVLMRLRLRGPKMQAIVRRLDAPH